MQKNQISNEFSHFKINFHYLEEIQASLYKKVDSVQ